MIDVNLSEAIPLELVETMESLDLTEAVLDDIATSARAKWIRLAQTELHSTRQTYIDGIQEVETRPGEREILLQGWMPNAIENGMDAYNMRDTLLGPNAKNRHPTMKALVPGQPRVRTGGWYANVPIRHGTPGSSGLAGSPMGAPYAPAGSNSRAGGPLTTEQSQALGKSVYGIARQLRKGTTVPRAAGGPLLREHHTTGIYSGMRRERKPYVNQTTGKTTVQSQYTTFRRISTDNPTGWMHPGIEPHHFAERVREHVNTIAPSVIAAAIEAALEGGE